jgi:hypothetical protein
MTNREEALRDLAAVVAIVAAETDAKAMRVRLILPWIDQAKRRRILMRDLRSCLTPIFPVIEGKSEKADLQHVAGAIEDARNRPSRLKVDFAGEHVRLAGLAGVALPGSVRVDSTVDSAEVIAHQAKALADLASRIAVEGGRSVAIPSRAVAGDRRAPAAPSAPSVTGTKVEPSRAKAGEGGSLLAPPVDDGLPDHMKPGFWDRKPGANKAPPAPLFVNREVPKPRSDEELHALLEQERQASNR